MASGFCLCWCLWPVAVGPWLDYSGQSVPICLDHAVGSFLSLKKCWWDPCPQTKSNLPSCRIFLEPFHVLALLSYEEQFGPCSSQWWSRNKICFTDAFAWTRLGDCKKKKKSKLLFSTLKMSVFLCKKYGLLAFPEQLWGPSSPDACSYLETLTWSWGQLPTLCLDSPPILVCP